MLIQNCYVLNSAHCFEKASIQIEGDRIIKVIYGKESPDISDDLVIDANGSYAIPGLIDTHIHGTIHHDFCDNSREGLIQIAAYLKANGITTFCPTSMTLDVDLLKQIFATTKGVLPSQCAKIAGIHMEGPFISSEKKGAQNATFLRSPSIDVFHELSNMCDHHIKIITLAPELDTACDFIHTLHNTVNISIGHSVADYEMASNSFMQGANRVTHLYNAMTPFSHREPGIIGAAFDNKEVYVELIADGVHVHPSVIRSTFEMFGSDRVVLVSDATMATGMPDGEYELGGQKVYKKGHFVSLDDGTIAGSATNLMEALKNCVSFGISLEAAVQAATENAAKSIGMFDTIGSIDAGKKADIVLLDHDLQIRNVILDGRM